MLLGFWCALGSVGRLALDVGRSDSVPVVLILADFMVSSWLALPGPVWQKLMIGKLYVFHRCIYNKVICSTGSEPFSHTSKISICHFNLTSGGTDRSLGKKFSFNKLPFVASHAYSGSFIWQITIYMIISIFLQASTSLHHLSLLCMLHLPILATSSSTSVLFIIFTTMQTSN